MKPTSEILERMNKSSKNHENGVFTRLYRYLLREDVYYSAYKNLYANQGASTKGIDNDTADGFGNEYIAKIIDDLKTMNYEPKPVRRTFIPKKNGKMRPLGIPSFRDKMVQDVIRQLLEAIYEPVFSDKSHGFRPNRSCHTALKQIKKGFNGCKWFVEGNIKGCFDNIDHKILLSILSKKIKDTKFINLIGKFLKSGYVEDWKYNVTYSGTPQGGILSPILSNIYLNELDIKIKKIKTEFDKLALRDRTKEYQAMTIAMGDSEVMQKAIDMLDEVKESIMNAYQLKTGLSRAKLSNMMDAESWMNANKAVELGFADSIMFQKETETAPSNEGVIFSRLAITNSTLSKLPHKEKPASTKINTLDKRLELLKY